MYLLSLAAIVGITACADPTGVAKSLLNASGRVSASTSPTPASSISWVQILGVQSQMPQSAGVIVTAITRDLTNHPIPGEKVTWAVNVRQAGAAVITPLSDTSARLIPVIVGQSVQVTATTGSGKVGAVGFVVAAGDSAAAARAAAAATATTPAKVSVTPGSGQLAQGSTLQLSATAYNGAGSPLSGSTFAWRSSDTTVAKVSAAGLVSGVKGGPATITATTSGVSGTSSLTVTVPPPSTSTSGRWVLGYYMGYQRNLYPESSVDFSRLTHVITGAVEPTTTGGLDTTFFIDNVNGPAMARTLASRAHAAGRKALLMVGGSSYHDAFASAASSTNRSSFVANLVRALSTLGYDGLDLDWEPINTADQPSVLALVQALRAAKPGLLITVPVGFFSYNYSFPVQEDPWWAQVAPLVDRLDIMSYDGAGAWPGWQSWHNGALHDAQGSHPSSVQAAVQGYLNAGVPASKLVPGIGTYGQCWNGGVTAPRQTLPSTAQMVASDNTISYANIVASYAPRMTAVRDTVAGVPYLTSPTAQGPSGCTYISYDDAWSAGLKGSYAKAQGLGGVMLWTINEQHLASAPSGSQDPLMAAAYTAAAP